MNGGIVEYWDIVLITIGFVVMEELLYLTKETNEPKTLLPHLRSPMALST